MKHHMMIQKELEQLLPKHKVDITLLTHISDHYDQCKSVFAAMAFLEVPLPIQKKMMKMLQTFSKEKHDLNTLYISKLNQVMRIHKTEVNETVTKLNQEYIYWLNRYHQTNVYQKQQVMTDFYNHWIYYQPQIRNIETHLNSIYRDILAPLQMVEEMEFLSLTLLNSYSLFSHFITHSELEWTLDFHRQYLQQ